MSQTRNPDSKRFQLNIVESRRGGGARGRETPVGDPLKKGEHPQRTKTERTKKKKKKEGRREAQRVVKGKEEVRYEVGTGGGGRGLGAQLYSLR
jgi:hypothetical protein